MQNLDRAAERNRGDDAHSDVIEAVPSILMRGAMYSFVAITVIALGISIFTKVHVKVPAKGAVVPEGRNVSVESREQGVALIVHVAEGDRIKKGDPILTLQRSQSHIDLAALSQSVKLEQTKLNQLTTAREVSRLVISDPQIVLKRESSAFIDAGAALVYVNALRKALKDVKQAKFHLKRFIDEERDLSLSQIALSKDTLGQHQQKVKTGQRVLETRRKTLVRKREQLEKIEILEAKRIVPRSQLNTAQDAVNTAIGQVNQQQQEIAQSNLSISTTRLSIANLQAAMIKKDKEINLAVEQAQGAAEQAITEMGAAITTFTNTINTTQANIARLNSKHKLQEVQIGNLNIVSPVDGLITSLGINTAGRMVGRGNSVAIIVPDTEKRIVLATVKNKDTAFVRQGLPARIKVDAFPYRKFGTIEAEVLSLYPIPNKAEFAVRLELKNRPSRSVVKICP